MKRLALGTLVLVGAASTAALQDQKPPQLKGIDVAAFGKLGLEQRWVTYRQSIVRDAAQSTVWMQFLEARKDFELLEQLAIYEGYQQLFIKGKPGEILHRRDAPQWMRVALWNIKQRDSHSVQAATTPLEASSGRFVGWAEKFPEVKRLGGKTLLEKLRDTEPVDPGDQLPPLDPQTVILPFLDAPKKLPDLAPTDEFDKRKRYRFQVLRAIRAVSVAGVFAEPYRSKLLRLCRHADREVRRTAMLEFSEFPTDLVPWSELIVLADMEQIDGEDRGAALLAASYSNHPAVYLKLHDVLADPKHPALSAVVSRMHSLGDGYTLEVLKQLPRGDVPEAVRSRLAGLDRSLPRVVNQRTAHRSGATAATLLTRTAWATQTGHPKVEALLKWTRAHATHRLQKPEFATKLRNVATKPESTTIPKHLHELAGEEARRILRSK